MIDIQLGSTVKRNNAYPFQRVLDETIIVEPRTRQMHHLNEVGSDIWEFLSEPHTVHEVISQIIGEYEVDNTVLHKDVMRFLKEMLEHNLIVRLLERSELQPTIPTPSVGLGQEPLRGVGGSNSLPLKLPPIMLK